MSKLRSTLDQYFNNLNTHPIPLEFSKGLTTAERLDGIYSLISEYLDQYEDFQDDTNGKIENTLNRTKNELSIYVNDLFNTQLSSSTIIDTIRSIITGEIADSFKLVQFGLSDNGYFYADIPDTWNIVFDTIVDSTNVNYGKLIIKY